MYEAILSSLNVGPIVYVDNEHIIRYMNPAACKAFAKSGGNNIVGKSLFDCHQPSSTAKIKAYFREMQSGDLEEVVVRKSKKGKTIMQAVKNETGVLIGYLERHEYMQEVKESLKDNLYQQSYNLYDEVHKDMEDIEFYKEVIPTNAKVLELGCGTGRVGLELSKRGNYVVGLDLSQPMLNIYNNKIVKGLDAIKGRAKTHLDNITTFDLGEKFDYIIFPFRVFQVLFSDKFRNTCLSQVKRHLKKDGKVIINMFNPIVEYFEGWNNKSEVDIEIYSETLDVTIRRQYFGERHFEKQQIISYKNVYEIIKDSKVIEIYKEPMRLAYLFKEQADQLFENNDFNVDELYGNWHFEPVNSKKKEELIYILSTKS